MLDVVMIGLFVILPSLMLGLANWSSALVDQGSEKF
ncbi:signal peptide protein [Jeotgalibacillus sp. ET6]|nr:signal peptide protein [Jeotgalibacillus sp. ET6]MDG5472475.1 signal peptide protein [Jeotgalibacillus sp. ET6]